MGYTVLVSVHSFKRFFGTYHMPNSLVGTMATVAPRRVHFNLSRFSSLSLPLCPPLYLVQRGSIGKQAAERRWDSHGREGGIHNGPALLLGGSNRRKFGKRLTLNHWFPLVNFNPISQVSPLTLNLKPNVHLKMNLTSRLLF